MSCMTAVTIVGTVYVGTVYVIFNMYAFYRSYNQLIPIFIDEFNNVITCAYNYDIILGDFKIPTKLPTKYSTRLTNILNSSIIYNLLTFLLAIRV